MTNGQDEEVFDIEGLERALESLKAEVGEEKMSEYHRNLLKWCRNMDKRYAWVILIASFVLMVGTLGPCRMQSLIYATVIQQGVYTHEEATWPSSLIFTVENTIGPVVSIIVYYISYRKSIFIGLLLITLANSFALFSERLWLDILLIGVVQGLGYAFIFMPFMEIINSYFYRHRNIALGAALSGATVSNYLLLPLFQWILGNCHWRYAYLGIACITAAGLLIVPLLRVNRKPDPVEPLEPPTPIMGKRETFARFSIRALNYRSSTRSHSSIASGKDKPLAPAVVVPALNDGISLEMGVPESLQAQQGATQSSRAQFPLSSLENYENSLFLAGDEAGSKLSMSLILDIFKTPAFHLIWYNETIYFWIAGVLGLIVVDYAIDKGSTKEQAEMLVNFQVTGEMIGRLILPYLVDMQFISKRYTTVIMHIALSLLLFLSTQMSGFSAAAALTLLSFCFASLQYILLDSLLVEYLGERKVTLGFGLSSCISGILMSFRPQAVGYCRDQLGNYEILINCIAAFSLLGAVPWLFEPQLTKLFKGNRTSSK